MALNAGICAAAYVNEINTAYPGMSDAEKAAEITRVTVLIRNIFDHIKANMVVASAVASVTLVEPGSGTSGPGTAVSSTIT